MPPFLVALLPFVPQIVTLALPIVLGWLGTLHFKNASIEKAKAWALNAADTVAKQVAIPYLAELATDAGDGIITPEEQAKADANAVAAMLALIPAADAALLRTLFPGPALSGFLMGLLHAATHDATLARQAAFAAVPGLTSTTNGE